MTRPCARALAYKNTHRAKRTQARCAKIPPEEKPPALAAQAHPSKSGERPEVLLLVLVTQSLADLVALVLRDLLAALLFDGTHVKLPRCDGW